MGQPARARREPASRWPTASPHPTCSPDTRRFLRFVTGTPRLPPGGLAALQPRLTVVRKLSAAAAAGVEGTSAPLGSLSAPSGGGSLPTGAKHPADGDLPSGEEQSSVQGLPGWVVTSWWRGQRWARCNSRSRSSTSCPATQLMLGPPSGDAAHSALAGHVRAPTNTTHTPPTRPLQ